MNYSITKYGKPLSKDRCRIDFSNKTFSSSEDDLELDFSTFSRWTFKIGSFCTIQTGDWCTFYTDSLGVFYTGSECIFNTGSDCTFYTGGHCTFKTSYGGTFNTGGWCTFKTGGECTFDTGGGCTFSLYNIKSCKFKSHDDISIILDRNDREAYKLTKELLQLLKLNKG